MYRIQEFTRERIYEDSTGKKNILPPIITTKFPETRNCYFPDCESCMLDCSKNRSTIATRVKPLLEKEGYLTGDKYEVGYSVFTDHFICNNTV